LRQRSRRGTGNNVLGIGSRSMHEVMLGSPENDREVIVKLSLQGLRELGDFFSFLHFLVDSFAHLKDRFNSHEGVLPAFEFKSDFDDLGSHLTELSEALGVSNLDGACQTGSRVISFDGFLSMSLEQVAQTLELTLTFVKLAEFNCLIDHSLVKVIEH
jgi:hypothetical protein